MASGEKTTTMETMRLTLIFLHVLIVIFLFVNFHPDSSAICEATARCTKIVSTVVYISDSLRILLYHTASILAVWFSRQYGAGVVRASGLLLIGELLQLMTKVIQQMVEVERLPADELYFITALDLLLLIAVLMTFRLAEKLSKHQRNQMQAELLADTVPRDDRSQPTTL